ncbi:MAG TPA: phosphatidylserine decarboxylase [Verrucomicrobiae bacterium]|nr:phosphatidylserine decarboxylase [Verrucomicrobiae bacterium]
MKHSGRARKSALKLILWTLVALGILFIAGPVAISLGVLISSLSVFFLVAWVIFAAFTLYFFRDPNPRVPNEPNLIVSPAHGKVDAIDEIAELQFMGGPCKRVSTFLSVVDVHVQNAPVSGKVILYKYTVGEFLNALKAESAVHNENAFIGLESAERPGTKIGVRLISGVIARRIVPFVNAGDDIIRGERISLIQFGSRVDLYLPLSAKVKVKIGDHVVGGETIMATFD